MNANEIIRILVEEKSYDADQTQRLEPKIEALPEDIRLALENWVLTGCEDSPTYGGFTVRDILAAQPRMTVLNAYLTLVWLRRDERTAKKALARPIIVRRPRA